MFDDMIFFEICVFRMFCERVKITPSYADKLFCEYEIWDYIEEIYRIGEDNNVRWLNSDISVMEEVLEILAAKGVQYGIC